jgi:hypothetical protein
MMGVGPAHLELCLHVGPRQGELSHHICPAVLGRDVERGCPCLRGEEPGESTVIADGNVGRRVKG